MAYRFIRQSLVSGLYEPEGIYLSPPHEGEIKILQYWADNSDRYAAFKYNGIPLKGHPGVDFAVTPGTRLLAVDQGRVVEIGYEPHGFERYLKIEHRWGEAFYAYVGESVADSGQVVKRGDMLATADYSLALTQSILHFAIRVVPYNRFDGWGGFTDPLPYLDPTHLAVPDDDPEQESTSFYHEMVVETPGLRRP